MVIRGRKQEVEREKGERKREERGESKEWIRERNTQKEKGEVGRSKG